MRSRPNGHGQADTAILNELYIYVYLINDITILGTPRMSVLTEILKSKIYNIMANFFIDIWNLNVDDILELI